MVRTSDYYRYQRHRAICRKRHIIHGQNDYWHVKHDGMLSKGKIHCSCWMCRRKSFDRTKIQDARKYLSLLNDAQEYFERDNPLINSLSRKIKLD